MTIFDFRLEPLYSPYWLMAATGAEIMANLKDMARPMEKDCRRTFYTVLPSSGSKKKAIPESDSVDAVFDLKLIPPLRNLQLTIRHMDSQEDECLVKFSNISGLFNDVAVRRMLSVGIFYYLLF